MTVLSTVEKACKVLELFTEEKPEWRVTEIARALDIPKSSASGIVSTLAQQGLLRRMPNARYRLGWRMLAMSEVLLKSSDFRQEAHRVMKQLVAEYGETVHLATLEQGKVVYVNKLEGTRAVRVHLTGLGRRLPAHCSALGKVLLAYQSWKEVVRIIEKEGMPAFTPHTITTLDALERELIQVRRQGYAIDNEEVALELCCVAAPIRDVTRKVVAAMSFSVPAYRFHTNVGRYKEAIIRACDKVSKRLGYVEKRRKVC